MEQYVKDPEKNKLDHPTIDAGNTNNRGTEQGTDESEIDVMNRFNQLVTISEGIESNLAYNDKIKGRVQDRDVKIELEPICKLKSKITFLKEVEEGTSIGYSGTYVTNRKSKIATIPIGYADGLRRALSNKGDVVINRKRVPIIGNVCMDGFMADVTDLENVKVGDDVYIWDNEIITLEEVADLSNTINYEIMSTISNRVPRVFIKK